MIKIKIPLMFFLLLVSLTFVFAEEVNLSVEDQATICINESRLIIDELQVANFSIERANDSLKQASNIYLSQTLLEKNGRTGDFGLVLPHCNTISQLKEDAYNSRDALLALDRFYNETFQDDKINTSSVDIMITQINDEIKSERYEKVQPLITQTYEEIINVKSEYSTLNLFYNSTSRSLKKFFLDNWQIIIISLSGLLVLFLIYRSSIHRILIKKKIANLTSRKESLRRLIMKTQKEYFEGNTMSESTYTIRTKSFAEMVRDIDRQIPLLQERLFMYSGGRSKEETHYAKKDEKHKKKDKKKVEKHKVKHEKTTVKKTSKGHKKAWKSFKPKHKKIKKVTKRTK